MENTLENIRSLLSRGLQALEKEMSAYENDADAWKIVPGISNSAGTLCLHLCGNLQHYIGATLGKSGYKRNREQEFSWRDVPVNTMLEQIGVTRQVMEQTLANLDAGILELPFPEQIAGKELQTGYFLLHLLAHFNYHLGQINYHRRALCRIE